ncbi:hypothetical protein A6769_09880 [Nostoc punctiforme NIES-2108]|uniref:NACHT conflict system C-terminal helical domain-containing protein n=1 Tax=Nostoc punctiforme NIES-2108 TaxID=1356359 RepID=A0A367RNI8_NOSPU|nr:hypothetical protein A6769_09880 [Nostoc punctiforme NIES-2108]
MEVADFDEEQIAIFAHNWFRLINWQFSYKQAKLLQQYYNSNKLLVNCLNIDCNISEKIRQEIEHNLLLPISKLETENNKEIS